MSLDAIRKSILSEAGSRASAIEAEAAKEASRIVKEAEERARNIVKDAEREAKAEAERLTGEAQAGVETEASSMMNGARSEAVERSLKKVMAGVRSEIAKSGMKRILDQGLKQFKETAGSAGEIVVKTGKSNAGLVKGRGFRVEYGDVSGFVISTASGAIALNATIGSITERATDYARKAVSAELFKGRTASGGRKAGARAPRAKAQRRRPAKSGSKARPKARPKAAGRGRRG